MTSLARTLRRHLLAAMTGIPLLAPAATGQTGPGLPNLAFPPGELFRAIATIGSGNHGKPMMHAGYLTLFHSWPTPGASFYDVSNPYAPTFVNAVGGVGMDLPELHTHVQTTAWGGEHVVLVRGFGPRAAGGGAGLAIWDWTDVTAPRLESSFDLPGVPGGYLTGLFWHTAQAPYVYCPAGSLGLFIVNASDPANPVVVAQIPKAQTGGFNAVLAFAIGNMLILTNNDAGTGVGHGFARLDISDPVAPQLVYSTTDTSSPYGASVNGGRLIVPGVDGTFSVHDLYSPTFAVIDDAFFVGTRGASAVVQDGFCHVGASTAYYKMDLADPSNYQLVNGWSTLQPIRDEDWVTPLGNLVAVADDAGNGTHLVVHAASPDVRGPTVNMVVPADGATQLALTSRVGITLTDMIELGSIDETTFTVRPVGGAPLTGGYSHQFGIVNFVPEQPLQPSTTYEVVVPSGGMRDWTGNPVPRPFVSRFSTGSSVSVVRVAAAASNPVELGQPATFDVASSSGPGTLQYSWSFGDGSPPTPFSSSPQAAHTYAAAGHYSAQVTVTNGALTGSDAFIQTVHYAPTAAAPSRASTVVVDDAGGLVWCVNADNDTVTAVDRASLSVVLEAAVGRHPRTLALAPDGTVWVACQGDATVWVLDSASGAMLTTIELPYASAPYGIAMSPDGGAAYVTLHATGQLAKLDPSTRRLVGTARVGPEPKGLAVASDSERIFVSRFVSSAALPDASGPDADGAAGAAQQRVVDPRLGAPLPRASVYEVSARTFRRVRVIPLAFDPGPDTEASGRGLPNYLSTLTVSPDGRRLWVPSKKDNIARGAFRSGEALTHESTVRTIVSQIDLGQSREDLAARIDFNDRDMAFAVVLTPRGDYAFHALQGSNAVLVTDAYTGDLVASVDGTGFAPQGLALTSDGATLFVHNFTSRNLTAYDVRGVTASIDFAMPERGRVTTVANERLAPDVLRGQQIFYNAADPRMNQDGYISCASCHLDGGQDGRVWDFTDRGEGLRNTVSMRGKAGLGHGRVHWTGNFDEIQDFEHDMRGSFGGAGFLLPWQWTSGTVAAPLGTPKAGLSPELDALAAYVGSLQTFDRSPHRNPDGTLTAAGQAGKVHFTRLACAQCHVGPAFSDSALGALHDVGTATAASGQASGAPLVGFDTPTLRDLWATGPYLHDGSALTLMEVLTTRNPLGQHGATSSLTRQERRELVQYLLQIDGLEPGPR
ncbi:MAG: Ig-like domain-containing protein [Planctomycetota bacterium]